MKAKKLQRNILIAAVWLALWCVLDRVISNEILFVGPAAACRALIRLLGTREFYISIASTLTRIAAGFCSGACAGIALAVLSYRYRAVGELLEPFFMILKSTPVVSFVILLLIWAGNANLSLLVCFFVVIPILYLNTQSGLEAVDAKLLELAHVFNIPLPAQIRYIYIPALRPNLSGALSLSLGMSWKSGVAAEVIGQPLHTIGNALYRSKIFFETADVFAWTIVIIIMSWIFERGVMTLLERRDRRAVHERAVNAGAVHDRAADAGESCASGCADNARLQEAHEGSDAYEKAPENPETLHMDGRASENSETSGMEGRAAADIRIPGTGAGTAVSLVKISKSYDKRPVLRGYDAAFESGGAYLLTGPSGSGKTTLIRILLGLETADAGSVLYTSKPSFGAVFQEDRLCEEFSAADNVAMIFRHPDREMIRRELSRILPGDSLDKPVCELSGGMRRRVCIVRACLRPSQFLVMDEPFNGLDAETRRHCIDYIKERQGSRTLLIASHLVDGLEYCHRIRL